jgi:hypothetical protein
MAETKTDDVPLPALASVASTFHALLAGVPVSKHCSPAKTLHIEASKTTDEALKLLAAADVTEAHIFDDTTSVSVLKVPDWPCDQLVMLSKPR